ncbi:EthD family reductase [Aestuariivivens sediminis]|uniref:EthD family reductase n=1 Tax=Aestuariivivens sediminis TaxID=2913557 RepID=UPI001F59C91F|nr:EthD family reductase [Aestuariivivens sediminis]
MKKGTIKVSVLYPGKAGSTFDMDYYCHQHVPMVGGLLGDALLGATIEKGLSGGAPDSAAPYVAMGNIYFESIESFQNSFGAHADKIMGDLPNFTNIEPVVQISEVLV